MLPASAIAAETFFAVAGAITRSRGSSPAAVINVAGARSQSPKHELRCPIAFPPEHGLPAGPSLPSIPFGFRFAENRVNGGFFFSTSFGVRQMQVHSVLHALLDANGRRFEFRRSGLGIHRVNGEIIRRDLLVKMDREKSKPRPQA